ncbi:hypothetical protein HPB50_017292 [Hyalomma asiaticum]|uniref:Uncharacterized protein n=1 Tax=Hyalomma asiaticum TaxID=266040 RepID=A0ACB7RJM1_HYAAI|nr:hypothetical protein HPB50_017292 [Hyalomma asiaticum]
MSSCASRPPDHEEVQFFVSDSVGTAKLDMAGSASAPLLSTPDANRAELGEDDEIQAMEGTEWHVVQSKSAKKKQAMERGIRNAPPSSHDCVQVGAKSRRRAVALKKRVIAASRMPELPSTHQKIIVRPRGGLDLRRTSCYGISTAIFTAAGITAIQASSDLVCPNIMQNIVVRRKEREMERAFDMDLRDFPAHGAEMTGPSSGGWLQPFTMGGGPVLPIPAKWASKDKNPEPYKTQAGPSTQVSGGTVTAKESEELQKVRNENAKLSSELAQVKKELASLTNAVSLSSHDGDQNGANGRKCRAVGDVPEVDVTDTLNQIKESLKHISSTLQELTKDIVIVKAQNRFLDSRVRDLECKTGLPEPAPLPTELSQLISDPTIVAELVQKQIPCTPSDPKAQSRDPKAQPCAKTKY